MFYIPAMKIYEIRILNVKLILCFKDFGLKTCGGMDTNPELNIFVSAFAKLRKEIIIFVMYVCRSVRLEDMVPTGRIFMKFCVRILTKICL